MILTELSSIYDISNDIMNVSILEISNDDICGMGLPINFAFDSRCL